MRPSLLLLLGIWALLGTTQATPFSYSNTTDEDSAPLLHRETRQARSCVYTHTFSNVGEFVYLNSENYPGNYLPNLDCRYTINAPRGTQITLECDDFNVEASANCVYDKFYWSISGDPFYRDSQYACGAGQLNRVTSTGNTMAIGFKSDGSNPQSSSVYRYRCKLTTIPTPCSCGVSGSVIQTDKDQNKSIFLSTRIVGGTESQPGELPWNVLLYTQTQGPFCGASLISQNWLLTAAHCCDGVDSGETLYADIGDHDITTASEAQNQVIAVDRKMINSLYNRANQDNDVCLLHLSKPVSYSKNIQPVCLPWKFTSMNFDNVVGTASGWGTTYFGGPQATKLRKVQLQCKSTPTCRQIYADRAVTITENMFCASSPGKDTCQSDSGGPMQYYDSATGQWYEIGVVSFGQGCAEPNSPGVYAIVAKYLGWIEQNTGETYCKK